MLINTSYLLTYYVLQTSAKSFFTLQVETIRDNTETIRDSTDADVGGRAFFVDDWKSVDVDETFIGASLGQRRSSDVLQIVAQ